RGDIQARWNANQRASNIIETLWRTLDLEKGGEIAANLDKLYGFMLDRLTQVDLKNDPAPAREVATLLEPLRRSWHELVQREAQAAAAQRPDPAAAGNTDRRLAVSA
ncbi:MAG TPA: flagellar export chaperone FliS, partial [Hypericibacter adhaerens]|uniref:flagellar export chaperone FliS n=1 Tax=Hypericibacter adhaerens TaxID=2602016 RepID=UPI002B7389F1